MVTVRAPERRAARERREQSRARYPDLTGTVERNGVQLFYEVYGTGEPTVLLMPTWSIIHSRQWKRRSPTSRGFAAWSRSTVAGTAARIGPRTPRHTRGASSLADALAVLDATAHRAGRGRRLCGGAELVTAACRRPSRARQDARLHRTGAALAAPTSGACEYGVRGATATETAGGSGTATTGSTTTRTSSSSSSPSCLTEPHSTKPREDCVGWGLDTDRRNARWRPSSRRGSWTKRRSRRSCRASGARWSSSTAATTPCQPVARRHRLAELAAGQLVVLDGRGISPTRAIPSG